MIKHADMSDYGDAPEVFVDGIGAIDFMQHSVRLRYFVQYPNENRLVLCLRWNLQAWLESAPVYREAKKLANAQGRLLLDTGSVH